MFKKILVPTDGSALSIRASNAAIAFAQANGSSIVAIAVAEIYPYPLIPEGGIVPDLTGYEDTIRMSARQQVDSVTANAVAAGVSCKSLTVQGFSPHEEILAAAREHDCDLIWMASHGRKGMDRLLMGSETQRVLAHATVPVLVFR